MRKIKTYKVFESSISSKEFGLYKYGETINENEFQILHRFVDPKWLDYRLKIIKDDNLYYTRFRFIESHLMKDNPYFYTYNVFEKFNDLKDYITLLYYLENKPKKSLNKLKIIKSKMDLDYTFIFLICCLHKLKDCMEFLLSQPDVDSNIQNLIPKESFKKFESNVSEEDFIPYGDSLNDLELKIIYNEIDNDKEWLTNHRFKEFKIYKDDAYYYLFHKHNNIFGGDTHLHRFEKFFDLRDYIAIIYFLEKKDESKLFSKLKETKLKLDFDDNVLIKMSKYWNWTDCINLLLTRPEVNPK